MDNSTLLPPGSLRYDRLGRINSILRMLSERLVVVCNPDKNITIDEAMIPFYGRSNLKQYLPRKHERGTKVWMWANVENGCVSVFQVYVHR